MNSRGWIVMGTFFLLMYTAYTWAYWYDGSSLWTSIKRSTFIFAAVAILLALIIRAAEWAASGDDK